MSAPPTGAALTDTQARFLAAVAGHVAGNRVREVYLFAPMRQGGVETGIAVLAVGEALPELPTVAAEKGAATAAPPEDAAEADGSHAIADGEADAADTADADAVPLGNDTMEVYAGAVCATDLGEASPPAVVDQRAPAATSATEADDEARTAADPADALEFTADVKELDAPPLPPRFTIFTARYRLQLKGPERGKWDVDVVEEADAPLVTVDAVVRGVQRRSGELTEVERLSGPEIARALAVPL